ncbi:hypothetical protein [Bradyrhizobium sp. 174]|uniref:hypothetical protein n=1 Tax=Bradyrhizobium sp. 174 TaxID=2782645 RepID=UPI001FFA22B5|nr:hypothetical protein [Bradyrhizobium sp. 174]MCK1577757.1 hypothetical protein [Bradyrhizobium sp. 174]
MTVVYGTHLNRAMTKSCGCWRHDMPSIAFRTHGMRRTAEYRTWCHIKTRCFNPRSKFYLRYGGRGITVCPEWAGSFENFFCDMGRRPSSLHSSERLRNNEGYKPDNCVWALPEVQAANRSTVNHIAFDGIVDTMAGWSRRRGIAYLKLRRRLKDGWAIERALTP